MVSVRSAAEARVALSAGCEILDIKEPRRGSLGMAALDVLAEIVCVVQSTRAPPLISAALGETLNWDDPTAASPISLPAGLSYLKLGMAGLGSDANWPVAWRTVRDRFCSRSTADSQWVAVIYADYRLCDAPSPTDVLDLATAEDCAAVLVDTCLKQQGRLWDWFSSAELSRLARAVQRSGRLFGVAGSLRAGDLGALAEVAPDLVAIRGAACSAGARDAAIAADALAHFRAAFDRAFG